MPEIAEAQALLAALARTDEVKAEAARRQQRRQLHVAYGNALIAARGYAAPETTEAFAKARKSAGGDKDAPERLAADYGLWVGSLVRGELLPMRTHAGVPRVTSRRGPIRPRPASLTASAGVTHWFAGEYREAREHLERALAIFQPGATTIWPFASGMTRRRIPRPVGPRVVAARRRRKGGFSRRASAGADRRCAARRLPGSREISCDGIRIDVRRPLARRSARHRTCPTRA